MGTVERMLPNNLTVAHYRVIVAFKNMRDFRLPPRYSRSVDCTKLRVVGWQQITDADVLKEMTVYVAQGIVLSTRMIKK
jgi:hypothetical protein